MQQSNQIRRLVWHERSAMVHDVHTVGVFTGWRRIASGGSYGLLRGFYAGSTDGGSVGDRRLPARGRGDLRLPGQQRQDGPLRNRDHAAN